MRIGKIEVNTYQLVFGVLGIILIAAGLSTIVFNQNLAPKNITSANLPILGSAPDVQGISAWINSRPLSLAQLRGKVVLVDFWTYSCINCIRSIPHNNAWYNAYGNNGLVIIGVSTPEFQFEHNYSNVANAVQRFGIRYPVALDNNYATWDAYSNEYWPADYLIDQNGNVRFVSYGEGDYNTTELAIRALLESAGYAVPQNLTNVPLGVNFSGIGTTELYVGYKTARAPIGNKEGFSGNQTVNYSLSVVSSNSTVYFYGSWFNAPDGMVASGGSKLFLIYKANKVNIVAGMQGTSSSMLTVKLDGKNISQSELGADARIVNGSAVVDVNSYRLYNLVATRAYNWHKLEIDASPGFKLYTFTFG